MIVFKAFVFFFALSAFIPLSRNKYWLIRAFDFPRLQIFIINITIFLYLFYSLLIKNESNNLIMVCLVLVALTLDAYRILPYFPFITLFSNKKPVKDPKDFKVVCSNVLIENKEYDLFLEMVRKINPEILVMLETDNKWDQACSSSLSSKYKYSVRRPQENGYGILLFSQYELVDIKINFLADSKVPSIYSKANINNQLVNLIVLHPRPPGLIKSTSKMRDQELDKTASYISNSKIKNTIVVGDLNDVAWSHSSRKFIRESKLVDPRRGRGFYNTFPVNWPFFRYPLDHIFYSGEFILMQIKRLESIKSDHFPVMVELKLK